MSEDTRDEPDVLTGRVVAVTGASAGIGAATARLLAHRGAVVVLGARSAEALEKQAGRIVQDGGTASWGVVDVADRESMQGFVDQAVAAHGRLDVLVGNAGYGPIAPIDELRVEDWQRIVDVNLMGLLWGVAAALPVFRAQGSGHFVQTLSTSGLKIVPGQSVYAAAKNAARTFCEALRQEVGSDIRVTSVSPGMVATDFAGSTPDPALREQMLARRDELAIPPEAIARAIAFAVEQPPDVDVNEIVVRPTAQA